MNVVHNIGVTRLEQFLWFDFSLFPSTTSKRHFALEVLSKCSYWKIYCRY